MMGARLLRTGDTEHGFAGWIIAASTGSGRRYATVSRSLAYRPVVLTLWAIVALLIVPFYMFSQRELAPAEDQGVVFSIVQAAANSTIDQTKLFAAEINKVYQSFPEAAGPSSSPSRPAASAAWSPSPGANAPRRRSSSRWKWRAPSRYPGRPRVSADAPPTSRWRRFPVDLVISSAAEPRSSSRSPDSSSRSLRQRHVHLR